MNIEKAQALDAGSDLYRKLLESMTDGVSLATEAGIIVYTNPAEDRMFGYQRGELIGQHVSVQNAYPPEENARIVAEVISELKRVGLWHGEWRNRRKDGSEFFTSSRITSVEFGGRRHFMCVQADITQRRLAEIAQQESEARLELASAAASLGIWDWDLRTNRMVYSERAKQIFGFPADEPVTFEMVRDATHPEDHPRTSAMAKRAFDPDLRERKPYEYRIIRRDGTVRWALAHGEAVFEMVDGQERAVRYVGTIQDITDRKSTEQALQESEARLRLALDAGRMVVWEHEGATDRIKPSPELNRLLGFAPDQEVTTDMIRARYAPGERERLRALGEAAMARGDAVIDADLRIERDGEIRWLQLRAEILYQPEGPPNVIGVALDVTERKKAEQQLRLMVNELNHRVKNTLATIQAVAAQSFRGAASMEAARRSFEARLFALSHAHDVLTQEHWEGADLAEVVAGTLQTHPGEEQRFQIGGPPVRLPPHTALSLTMAFHELATNAIKYGALSVPDGRVELTWTVIEETDGCRLTISWKEAGGPPVSPPERQGFGTRLIERSLAAESEGKATILYDPAGLACTLTAVLPKPD